MEMISLSGQFLLALPGIGDPRFRQSVIAVCAHDQAGAFGLCLHRVVEDLTLPDLMRQMDVEPGETAALSVLAGGPVEPTRGFVLHTPDWSGRETRLVGGRWALTSTLDILRAIAGGDGPRQFVVALGYAGWGPGQLEEELQHHGWYSAGGCDRLLFETEPSLRWKLGFACEGIDSTMLAADSGHA